MENNGYDDFASSTEWSLDFGNNNGPTNEQLYGRYENPPGYEATVNPLPSNTMYGNDFVPQGIGCDEEGCYDSRGNWVPHAEPEYFATPAQIQQQPSAEPYTVSGTRPQRQTSGFGGILTSLAGSYAAWQAAEAGQKPTAAALAASGQSSELSSIRSALSLLQGARRPAPSAQANRAVGEGGVTAPGQPRRMAPRQDAPPKTWMEKYGLMALGAVAVGGLAYKVATT